MLQELADESENHGVNMDKSKTKVIIENDIYTATTPDREHWKLQIPGTEIQHQRQQPRQGDSKQNHDRMDSIRHAPWRLQG